MPIARLAHSMGLLILAFAWAGRAAESITIDDFRGPAPAGWSAGTGLSRGERPLSIAWDAQRKANVLCVQARYSGGPLFLTKELGRPLPMWNCESISFWYKLSSNRLSAERALVCRLRTGPAEFADCPVATSGSILPGRWVHARIEPAKRKSLVNVYKSYFSTIKQLTFRFDGQDQSKVDFEFRVGPIEVVLRNPQATDYSPRIAEGWQPADHRDVLVVRNSAACYYDLENLARRLGTPGKVDVRLFRGIHFPIFGFPGARDELLRYGLIVLVDVDPYVFTGQQVQWIVDLVASGGAILACGGPNTFGHAVVDFPPALADCLPVRFDRQSVLAAVGRQPALLRGHPITAGIPPRLGRVAQAHLLRAKADAVSPVSVPPTPPNVEPLPVLVVGSYHRGRSAVLNAFPDVGHRLEGDFFTSDFYGDLLVQAMRWLMRSEPPLTVEQFVPPPRHMAAGETAKIEIQVGPANRSAQAVCRCLDGSREVFTKEAAIKAGRAVFEITAPPRPDSGADYRIAVEVRGQPDRIEAARTFPLSVHAAVDAQIRFYYGKTAFAPRTSMRLRVLGRHWTGKAYTAPDAGPALTARAKVFDPAGELVGELPAQSLVADQGGGLAMAEFAWDVPDLSQGEYRIAAELLRAGAVASSVSRSFQVVDRLERAAFFPIMSIVGGGGGHSEDPAQIGRRLDDLWAHGFNVAAVAGVRGLKPWDELPHRMAMLNLTEAGAQARCMAVIHEYESYTNLHRDKRPETCVHSPGYAESLLRHAERYLAIGRTVPRLLSIKVTDEPFAGPAMIEGCDDCRRAWRARFGGEMPDLGKIRPDDFTARRQSIEFVRDYVAQGYRLGHRLKSEAGAQWDLLLTFCAPGYGYASDMLRGQEDLLWWAATADRIDFDVYPYFYPVSDKIVFLQAHFCMDLMRNVAVHLKKPWGFYVELDDRNYPMQINPLQASSECALTAIAHGADYLNSFINNTFGTGTQSRPERWEHLGQALRLVRQAGPLLAESRPQPARLALLFPYTHWQLSGKPWAPHYAHQLLLRAGGQSDILHEEVARREGRFACRALALLQTDYLSDDVAVLLTRFVKDGGLLLCDRVPRWNEHGKPCRLPAELFPAPPSAPPDGLRVTRSAFGKGETCFFSQDVDAAFKSAVDGDDHARQAAILTMLGDLLAARGLRGRVTTNRPEWEIGCREAKDTVVLTAVNHGSQETEAQVVLGQLPFVAGCVIDGQGRSYPLAKAADGVSFALKLPARCGTLLFAYPARPAELRLEVLTPQMARGQMLRYRVTACTADGSAARGRFVLPIAVIDPLGHEQERYAPARLTTDGLYEAAVPLAANAPPGKWQIVLSDGFSPQRRSATFEALTRTESPRRFPAGPRAGRAGTPRSP